MAIGGALWSLVSEHVGIPHVRWGCKSVPRAQRRRSAPAHRAIRRVASTLWAVHLGGQ